MKKIITLLLVFPLWGLSGLYAQKELWGVNDGDYVNVPGFPFNYGKIVKYDINGENPAIMHDFDSIHGYHPLGRLFLASNGKLYGTTLDGGNVDPLNSNNTAGLLFEYDLTINKYRVVHYFNRNDNPAIANPDIGVIEPTPGILIGATQNRIYKYDIANESITFSNPLLSQNTFRGELMKASNGHIYGTSWGGICPNVTTPEPYLGNITKYDMVTNNVSFAHSITCPQRELKGSAPSTQLVEASPGKLYGTCRDGGINFSNNPNSKGGTLFEFNVITNVFTKKIDFDYYINGGIPKNLVQGNNGKLYGLCEAGGASQSCNPGLNFGTIYEYNSTTNMLEVRQHLAQCLPSQSFLRYPQFLMRTSIGHFIIIDSSGFLFKWDAVSNEITFTSYIGNTANLIEICRKPSYQEIIVNTFDGCIGSTFTYDIQNSNATSYQWQKNNVNVTGQTTGILNLTNLSTNDAGAYTCVMTNECGITTTMVLNLTVNCLGTTTVATLDKAIKLYPNPTANWLNIDLPKNIDVTVSSCTITNLLGQTVNEVLFNNKIDVSQLRKGIYIVSLKTNYGDWNGKFVKE